MSAELLDLVVIRRENRERFTPRRVHADPDNHQLLLRYLRDIARGEDELPYADNWLSRYEMEVCPAGSESPLFVVSGRGEDED